MTFLLAARHSSCAAIGKMEFLRIIDPMLYRPLTDENCQERTTHSAHLCPSSPEEERGGREVDLIGFGGSNEAQSQGPRQQAAGREPLQDLAKEMGQRRLHRPAPRSATREGEMTMGTLPRTSKRDATHERTADDEQLADEHALRVRVIEGGRHGS
jgi:hypothetical protein